MSRPTLIRWVLAQFRPLATQQTDPYARESRNADHHGAAVQVRAQVADGPRARSRGAGGEDPSIQKRALVRLSDCALVSWTPRVGDQYTGHTNRLGETLDSTLLYVADIKRTAPGAMRDQYLELGLSDDAPARRVA